MIIRFIIAIGANLKRDKVQAQIMRCKALQGFGEGGRKRGLSALQ